MPLNHTIAIKLKEGITEEQIKNMNEGLRSLTKLDGVLSYESGKNFTSRAPLVGEVFVFSFIMKDKNALDHYMKHPDHVKVAGDLVGPIKDDMWGVDYEF